MSPKLIPLVVSLLLLAACAPIQSMQPIQPTPPAAEALPPVVESAPDAAPMTLAGSTADAPFDLAAALEARVAACDQSTWPDYRSVTNEIVLQMVDVLRAWAESEGANTPGAVERLDALAVEAEALQVDPCLAGLQAEFLFHLQSLRLNLASADDAPSYGLIVSFLELILVNMTTGFALMQSDPATAVFAFDGKIGYEMSPDTSEFGDLSYLDGLQELDEHSECEQVFPYEKAYADMFNQVRESMASTLARQEATDCSQFPVVTSRQQVTVTFTFDAPPGNEIMIMFVSGPSGEPATITGPELPFTTEVVLASGEEAMLRAVPQAVEMTPGAYTCTVTANGIPLTEFDEVTLAMVICGGYVP